VVAGETAHRRGEPFGVLATGAFEAICGSGRSAPSRLTNRYDGSYTRIGIPVTGLRPADGAPTPEVTTT
jgi:hypothetical protein